VILLDTHALVWWVNEPSRLGDKGKVAIEEAMRAKEVFASSISSWEIALLVERGRMQLALSVWDWIARCEALPFLTFISVSNAIAIESVRLPDFPQADPADRIIVATAMSLGARVVTKDEKISSYSLVKTIW
jgi:PIN domain nuclease of toxin-antitoxin system